MSLGPLAVHEGDGEAVLAMVPGIGFHHRSNARDLDGIFGDGSVCICGFRNICPRCPLHEQANFALGIGTGTGTTESHFQKMTRETRNYHKVVVLLTPRDRIVVRVSPTDERRCRHEYKEESAHA
jgi:hypothetical protein